jgi:asparagine synthase (glutamine-hydrolysing)
VLAALLQGPDRLAERPGDYAFAGIDDRAGQLTLGLAALSELQLFYLRKANGTIVFATDLRTLVRQHRPALDIASLSSVFHVPVFQTDPVLPFVGVKQVLPGTIVRFSRSGEESRRFWQVLEIDPEGPRLEDAAERLRAALEVAITDRIAALPGSMGTQLSAGRDSGAVTAITAQILAKRGEAVDAWTAAPTEAQRQHGSWLLDESGIARLNAERHGNVRHHILRPEPLDLCSRLDQLHEGLAQPLFLPIALAWCEPLWDAAERHGNRLLFCADFGNYALSAGGLLYLQDMLAEKGLLKGAANILAVALASPTAVRHILAHLLRPTTLPDNWHSEPLSEFITDEFRAIWQRVPRQDSRGSRTYRRWVREGIQLQMHPQKIVHIGRNLESSDPTRDQRVIEAIHSLPSQMLFSAPDRRKVYERAFGDILPAEVLRTRTPGVQNTDWHLSIRPQEIRAGLARYSASSLVRQFVDIDAIAAGLDAWPAGRCLGGPVYRRCVFGIMPALSLASFLWVEDGGS